jgi:WD40 repeat protein
VAHEALLRAWPRLNRWIVEERAELLARQELRWATERWTAGGRSEADLYRGLRLDNALQLAAGEALQGQEREFVEEGRQLRDREHAEVRRRTRRLRLLAAVSSVLAAAAIAIGVIAVVQRNDAQQARATANQAAREADQAATDAEQQRTVAEEAAKSAEIEALVGRAESIRATQRDTAALLAVEAFRLDDTARTRSALLSTFTDGEGFLDAHRIAGASGEFGHSGIVLPDGESAFYVDADGRLRPYDLDSGVAGEPFPALGDSNDTTSVLAASPDGAVIAQAAWWGRGDESSSTVGIYDTSTGALRFPPFVLHPGVSGATFTQDGRALAVATWPEGSLLAFDAETGEQVAEAAGVPVPETMREASGVVTVGDEVLLGSAADGTVQVFDAATFQLRRTITLPPRTVSVLQDVGDGTVLTGGIQGIGRFEVATGTVLWQHDGQDLCAYFTVDTDRDSFYCGDVYGRLEERDLATGLVLRRLDAQNGNSGMLWLARGGRELVAFGGNEPVIARWRLDGSGPITTLVAPGYLPVQFSPSGEQLIVERGQFDGGDYANRVVDVESGDVVRNLGDMAALTWRDEDTVGGAAINSSGQVELAQADLADGVVVLGGVIFDPVPYVESADPSKERVLLATDYPGRVELRTFDAATRQFGSPISVDGLNSADVSRSGHRVVVGTGSTAEGVVIYDGSTAERVGAIPGVNGGYVTPADQLFVTSFGGELTQHDLDSLEPLRTFGGSRGFIQQLVGTGDGSLIATKGGDRSVSLYDVATGTRIGTPITIADDPFDFFVLSTNGTRLAIPSADGVQIWDLEPDHWVDAACRVAGRNLTREEWDTNIGDVAPYRATCPAVASDG